MAGTGSSAEIGIRVFLDDAASSGLFAVNSQLGRLGTLARQAGLGFRGMSAEMVGLAVVAGLAGAFALFAGAIALSVKDAIDFQTQLIRIQRATNATSAEMQAMGNTLMAIGGQSVFSIQQIADGFIVLGQRGITAQQIIDGVGQAGVYLAESLGTTPVTAMTLLASAMVSFRIPATEAAHAADLLQFAMEHGVFSAAQWTGALAKLGGLAVTLGVPFDQIVVALDVLGRAMGSENVAATSLYYFLGRLASPTAAEAEAQKKLGLTVYDTHGKFIGFMPLLDELYTKLHGLTQQQQLDFLTKLFPLRGAQGIAILLNQIKSVHDLMDKLRTSHDNLGVAMMRARQAEDSAAGAWSGFKTNLQDVLTLVGGPFLALIQPLLLHLRDLAATIRQFAAANPTVIPTILALGAAISGIGLIVIAAMTPIGAFVLIMLAVMAAVTAGAVIIARLGAAWKQISSTVIEVNGGFTTIGGLIQAILGNFKGLAGFVVGQFTAAWKEVQQAFAQAGISSKDLTNFLHGLLAGLGAIAVIIISVVVGAIAGLAVGLRVLIVGIAYIITGIVQFDRGVRQVVSGLVHFIIDLFTGNFGRLGADLQRIWTGIKNIFLGALSTIGGLFVAVFGSIIGFVIGFINGIITFFIHLASILVGHSIIPDMMHAIQNIIISVLMAVLGRFINFGLQVISTVTHAFQLFLSVARFGMAGIQALITLALLRIIAAILSWASQTVAHANSAMSQFRGAVQAGLSAVMSFFQSLPGRILGALASLGSMLFQSGAHAMAQFAAGLWSMLGNVIAAVEAAASKVANFLAHHSPAKMGPLADDDQWMPNMMAMMARGIDEGAPLLHAALFRATGGMASVPQMARMGGPLPPIRAGGAGGVDGTKTFNLVVDGNVLAQWVMNVFTGHMQMNGLGRSFR